MRSSLVALALALVAAAEGCGQKGSAAGDAGPDFGPRAIVQIAAGLDGTCALAKEGDVYCWGDDARAEGSRSVTALPKPTRLRPAKVPGISGASSIGLTATYGCAVLATGNVQCFWEKDLGPFPLPPVDNALRVSLVKLHGLIEKRDGTVLTFVRPDKGDVTPKPFEALVGAKHAMTGDTHGCALMDGGRVRCWGAGQYGVLGDAEPAEGNVPRLLPSLTDIAELSVGPALNCALDQAGAVFCWGSNAFGEAGQPPAGFDGPPVSKPMKVPFIGRATHVFAGNFHACAILEGGALTCWGFDEYGETGHVPKGAPVPGLADVIDVALGEFHTCALERSGKVFCWGRNLRGNLGRGDVRDDPTPREVGFPR